MQNHFQHVYSQFINILSIYTECTACAVGFRDRLARLSIVNIASCPGSWKILTRSRYRALIVGGIVSDSHSDRSHEQVVSAFFLSFLTISLFCLHPCFAQDFVQSRRFVFVHVNAMCLGRPLVAQAAAMCSLQKLQVNPWNDYSCFEQRWSFGRMIFDLKEDIRGRAKIQVEYVDYTNSMNYCIIREAIYPTLSWCQFQ